jgi:hypothetical protein
MQPYRIHVSGASIPWEIKVASDFAAARRTQHMACPGDRLEVWRGEKCIFEREPAQRFG